MDVQQSITGYFNAYDYEDIVVDNTVKGFTLAKVLPTGTALDRDVGRARLIVATFDSADNARWQVVQAGGAIPGAPVAGGAGHKIGDGAVLSFANRNAMVNFRITRDAATSGNLRVTYYR